MGIESVGNFSPHPGLPKTTEPQENHVDEDFEKPPLQTILFSLHTGGVHCASLLRLAWSAVHTVPSASSAMPAIAITWVGAVGCLSCISIISETARTVKTLQELRKNPETKRKEYLRAALFPLLPHRPLLRDLCSVAAAALFGAKELLTKCPAAIGTACAVLGTTAGALTIVLGSFQIGFGIKQAIEAHKKIGAIEKMIDENNVALKELEDNSTSTFKTNIAQRIAKKNMLHEHLAYAKWQRTKSFLKVAAGVLVTIAGAIAIASFFIPPAYPLLAISLVVVGIGILATSISVGVDLKERVYKKQPLPFRDCRRHLTYITEKTTRNLKEMIARIEKHFQHLLSQKVSETPKKSL